MTASDMNHPEDEPAPESEAERVGRDRRCRAIFRSAVDFAMIATDRDGRVTEWNPGAERVLGWSAEAMRGEPIDCLFTPEDRAADRPGIEMRLALEVGRAGDDRWHLRQDGTRFWASGEMMPLRDEAGVHLGFLKILRDRTERRLANEAFRRAEERLAFSEESLRLATDVAEVGTWDLDLRTDTLTWSDRTKAMFGLSPHRPCDMDDFYAGLHPDDREATSAAFASALDPATRATYDVEYRTIGREDGVLRWVAARGRGLFDPDGRCVRAIGTAVDISARKAAEAQLRRSEAELRELNATLEARVEQRTRERDRSWNNSQDLQAILDADGVLQAVNKAWTTVLGWQADEIVGRCCLEFVHPDDQPPSTAALATAAAKGLPAYENRYRHKDGGWRWISWVAAPDENLVYASGRHVTAEREAAAELAATQETLRQSQKMEAVGQLTGGLAHDFNNLLTGIIGSLELIQARMAQGRLGEVDRYIGAAHGAARRAAALTQRLLAFSRRQTLDPRPTNINRLIAGMEELIRRSVGPAVATEVVGAGGLWSALVDRNQLENALLNLCINARDAMPEGGRLTIETANVWLDQRAATERELPPGQYVSLSVTDTGTGMAPDVVARAFDPFFTTKPLGEGTGLGLSMIYGFARQSGGQVRIYSELGSGTTMCLYLPRHPGDAEDADAIAGPPRSAGVRAGGTVLVVDDEPTVRMLIAEVLEESGYAAIEAADSATGLSVLQSDARIDLLITDVGLPGGMNGRQLANAARAARPGLKVLFITGYAENAAVGNGHLDPGMQVLTKPFAMEALRNKIREMIEG